MTYIKPDDEWRVDAEREENIRWTRCRRCHLRVGVRKGLPAPESCGNCAPTMRDLSGIHDSDECTCEQCRYANGYERRQQASSIVADVDRYAQLDQQPLWADAATVRAALADTLDSYPPAVIEHLFWHFNPEDESEAETQIRGVFIDSVIARVHQLQQPPHHYPRLEVLCDKHKRRRLPTYSGECLDCTKERLR